MELIGCDCAFLVLVQAQSRHIFSACYRPAHAELHTYARVLAPPTTRVVPVSPASRASVKANGAWLKAHRTAYRGRWVALRDGAFVRAADSFEDLVADLGDTTGLLLTKVV